MQEQYGAYRTLEQYGAHLKQSLGKEVSGLKGQVGRNGGAIGEKEPSTHQTHWGGGLRTGGGMGEQ